MVNIDHWITTLSDKLKAHFKHRLLFIGLQGSYRRKEAHKDSDIDVVVILEELSMDDLKLYREILMTMPEHEKACGFISGKSELMHWPKHELFQFKHDTHPYHGLLDDLLPCIEDKDIISSIKIEASSLYHICSHTIVHDPHNLDILKDMYKKSFFILESVNYLKNGFFAQSKNELLPYLNFHEKEILNISIYWDAEYKNILNNTEQYFKQMFDWTRTLLNTDYK